MLDFYLLKDEQAKPNHPDRLGLQFVGGLDDTTFGNLQKKGVLDQRFDYCADFRLGTESIKQIRQTIAQKQMQADTDVKKLTQLFDTAEKMHSGLMVYGD